MKGKKIRYIFIAGIAMTVIGVCAYAATMEQLSYVERFETGKVDIDIQELSAVEEGEEPGTENIVEANKDVSYVPRIINKNSDCYVRAQIDVVMDGECRQPLGIEHIYGMSEDWISRGGYFYYSKVLKEDQQTDLFGGIHIPEDWDYGDAESFYISVKVDAVQSANFAPDFTKELPWGAVELKEVERNETNHLHQAEPVKAISDVEYSSSGGFQCSTADLFDEFSEMMPGGRCEKIVNLKNTAKNPLKASMKITAEDSELNSKMLLCITAGDDAIYKGTIADAGNSDFSDVLKIDENKTGSIKLELALPADVDNSYTEMRDDIVWELNVEEIPDSNVQTGDLAGMLPYTAIALLALILMLCLTRHKRKDEDGTCY